MKKKIKKNYFFLSLFLLILLVGCTIKGTENSNSLTEKNIAVDKIEIIHFHGNNQCYSCILVGNYAEETIKTYFADELNSGKIVFEHVNGELPENREKVIKYGATGSSLWIGVYNKEGFYPEQNINVWYKINDKQVYMEYLKSVIEKKLYDDFSQ